MAQVADTLRALRAAARRAGGQWRWRFERANQHFPWLVAARPARLARDAARPADRPDPRAPRGPPRRLRARPLVPGAAPGPRAAARAGRRSRCGSCSSCGTTATCASSSTRCARSRRPGTRSSSCWGRRARARTRAPASSPACAPRTRHRPPPPSRSGRATAGPSSGRGSATRATTCATSSRRSPAREKLRARARGGAPGVDAPVRRRPLARSRRVRRALDRALATLAAAVPPGADVRALLAERRPDLVLVTPLVASPRARPSSSAPRASSGSRPCTASPRWDNLTTKGLVHEVADLTTVWNETQVRGGGRAARRAARAASWSPARTRYDHWFDWRPARDRATFCARPGCRPSGRSSSTCARRGFIAGDEVGVRGGVGRARCARGAEPELRRRRGARAPASRQPRRLGAGWTLRRRSGRRRGLAARTAPSPTTTPRAPTTSTRSTTPRRSSA